MVYYPIGGIRTFFRYVYRNFDPQKYSFTLVSPELSETKLLLDDLSELDLTYLPADNNLSNKEFFILVTNIIRNDRFDLIHSHGFTSGISAIVGSLLRWTPHILTCHDVFTEKQFIGVRGFIKKSFLGLMLLMIDSIHCVSYDARNNLLEYLAMLRIFKKKLIVVPHGIETELFLSAEKRDLRNELGLSKDSFLIGFLGRFMSQKGFKYLIDALEKMNQIKGIPKQPVILCFSQEDGFIREEKESIRKKGLSESVLFLPFVANVASTLKGLDVIAMPSLWEACGLLAMEAMVAGVPLIGTDCIGLREVLKNTPATVVPVRDSLALSKVLLEEMKNPSTIKAREFAIKAAARFEVRGRAKDLEKLMLRYLKN